MSEFDVVKDHARKEWIVFLAKMEASEGKAMTGLLAEAQLEAIAIWLRGSVGAEAAYNVLQRHMPMMWPGLWRGRGRGRDDLV